MQNNKLNRSVDVNSDNRKLTTEPNAFRTDSPKNLIDLKEIQISLEEKHNQAACKGCDGICCSRKSR